MSIVPTTKDAQGRCERHVFLEGRRIYLRALKEADLDGPWFQWLNDPEVSEHNGHAVLPNTEKAMRDYFNWTHSTRDAIVLAIILKEGDRHIGNLALLRISWISRVADLAILLGDKSLWGHGIASEACRLLVDYGFSRLGLHRIQCGTFSGNAGMKKLATRLGMTHEGTRREAAFKNARFENIEEYGLLRCEFLATAAQRLPGA